MKKAALGLALLATCALAELKWAASYEAGLAQAAKEKKKVMVMLSREECPACEYMEEIVFEEKAVAAEVHKYYVPIHLDIHKDFIPEGLGYIGTPTFHFLNSKGKKIGRHDGGENVPSFMSILRKFSK
jgi:thioredoxin-related protein